MQLSFGIEFNGPILFLVTQCLPVGILLKVVLLFITFGQDNNAYLPLYQLTTYMLNCGSKMVLEERLREAQMTLGNPLQFSVCWRVSMEVSRFPI